MSQDRRHEMPDAVAVEEALEIRCRGKDGEAFPVTVTLRTPGHDLELAAGFLYSEALIQGPRDLDTVEEVAGPSPASGTRVEVRLREGLLLDREHLARSFASTAACGVCGKTSLDAVFVKGLPSLVPGEPRVPEALFAALPGHLRAAQTVFDRTGGLHAAGLFDTRGNLQLLREDIGRHNAVDKVVGALLLAGGLPARDAILVVSGRAGFEIAQKALRAGIPILAAVGAPSTLTLRLAARAGMTVVGFLRESRFNLYTGSDRIDGCEEEPPEADHSP